MHYGLCENGELPMMAEVLKLLFVVLLLNYDFVRAHSEDLKMGYRYYCSRYSVLFTKHILEEIRKSSQNLHRVLQQNYKWRKEGMNLFTDTLCEPVA